MVGQVVVHRSQVDQQGLGREPRDAGRKARPKDMN